MNKSFLKVCLWAITLLTATTAMAVEKAPSLANLRINGMMMYDDDRSEEVLGIYEYSATAPIQRRRITAVNRQYVGGDAVVSGGKLYTYYMSASYGYVDMAFYTVIDLATGVGTKSANVSYDLEVAYSHRASSAAVNPIDGKVYCSGYEYDKTTQKLTPTLKLWDLTAQTKTSIGTMEAPLIVMAFDREGNLYGLTACSSKGSADGGYLVKVDTATGKLTKVGDTGVRPWLDQSGVISPYDGRLYWFSNVPVPGGDNNAAYSVLYAVDLTTAKAERIGDLPNGDEVVGAWIPEQTVADGAPGVATGVAAAFDGPSLKGSVNFTLPSTTYSGTALAGNLDWSVTIDGTTVARGNGEAGAQVSAPVTLSKSGAYNFGLTSTNSAGTSVATYVDTYVGYGTPAPATAVKFAIADGRHTVTWTPSAGITGKGATQDGGIAYRVVRQPGAVVVQESGVETSFSEAAIDGDLQSTYYEVTALNGDMTSTVAKSNAITTGTTVALPYSENFPNQGAFNTYAVVDANKDANTWYYSLTSAKIRQVTTGTQDDWLVLPPVRFEEGLSYEFKFKCYGTQVTNVNILDVAMGVSPESMTIPVASDIVVTDTKSAAQKELVFILKPTVTSTYRVGIHIKSAAKNGTFTVDDIAIASGKSTLIPAAPALKVAAGDKGAMSATVTVTLPTLTAGGQALTSPVTSLEVKRDGREVATLDVTEGKSEYTVIDTDITTAGTYNYTVTATNSLGRGEEGSQSVYIGRDAAVIPTDFRAVDNFDGTVTLTWSTPSAVGVNGGYVDIDALRYSVTNPDGTVTADIKTTSAQSTIATEGEQSEVRYTLGVRYADEPVANERTVPSNTLVAGAPYTLPFTEAFDGGKAATAVWSKELIAGKLSSIEFAMRADADRAGDTASGGGLHFTTYAAGIEARWISPVINLAAAESPQLSVWVKIPNAGLSLSLQVQDAKGAWTTLATVDGVADWHNVKADLTPHRSRGARLGFLVKTTGNFNFAYIDDISLTDTNGDDTAIDTIDDDSLATDLEVYTLQGIRVASPDRLATGLYIVRTSTSTRKIKIVK